MAQRSLVVDASVVVKWFSAEGERYVTQAVDIMDRHVSGDLLLVVPDLVYYEVANALAHKAALPDERVESSLRDLFALGMDTVPVDADLIAVSSRLARRANITVYDACYAGVAEKLSLPLVTANPRHQGRTLGCQAISLEEWRK